MSIFKAKIDTKTKIKIAVVVSIFLLVIGYIIWDVAAGGPLMSLLSNKEKVIAAVDSVGFFGPLLFMVLQILQTVFAPIPGQVVGLAGGFLFSWWGILWTTLGSAIGYFIVFWLSRKFGRSLVEKVVKKESLQKFDFIMNKNAAPILFMIFLIPGLPDDIVCYMAGLTNLPIRTLMILILLGHLPSIVVTNYIGSGLGESNLWPVAIASVIVVVIFVICWLKKDKIIQLLKSKQDKN